jgi:hypothetical protein
VSSLCRCGAYATADVALQDPDVPGVARIVSVCDPEDLRIGDELFDQIILAIWPRPIQYADIPGDWPPTREEMIAVRGPAAGR